MLSIGSKAYLTGSDTNLVRGDTCSEWSEWTNPVKVREHFKARYGPIDADYLSINNKNTCQLLNLESYEDGGTDYMKVEMGQDVGKRKGMNISKAGGIFGLISLAMAVGATYLYKRSNVDPLEDYR